MSDGDSATPGPPRLPGPPDPGDNQWLTRSPRPSPGAAPWERSGTSESEDVEKPRPTGNHTDGVTVADLIAKVHGDSSVPEELRRARPEPEAPRPAPLPPPAPPTEVIAAVRQPVAAKPDNADTEVIPVVSMPSSDLPDLARRRRADRVPPSRVGTGKVATGAEPRKRRKTMLAGRAAAALIAVLALALTGGAWQWQSSKNNMLNRVSALDPNSRDILDPNAQFGDENFLIVGVDSRFGENSDMGAGDTQDAGGTRSDTVMLVNIPANRKRVVAVSFPRDLAITPMQCEPWNPETHEYGPAVRRPDRVLRARRGVHRDQAELRLRVRRSEVPGEGDPETVRPVRKPVHGSRFRRVLQDGRRPRRCRGVQHDTAARTTSSAPCWPTPAARWSTATPHCSTCAPGR